MASDDLSRYSIADQVILGSITSLSKPKYFETIKVNIIQPFITYVLKYITPLVFILLFVFLITILMNVFVLIQVTRMRNFIVNSNNSISGLP